MDTSRQTSHNAPVQCSDLDSASGFSFFLFRLFSSIYSYFFLSLCFIIRINKFISFVFLSVLMRRLNLHFQDESKMQIEQKFQRIRKLQRITVTDLFDFSFQFTGNREQNKINGTHDSSG